MSGRVPYLTEKQCSSYFTLFLGKLGTAHNTDMGAAAEPITPPPFYLIFWEMGKWGQGKCRIGNGVSHHSLASRPSGVFAPSHIL